MPIDPTSVLLAGATGDLGSRVARALVRRGARVRAAVRADAKVDRVAPLEALGVAVIRVDFGDVDALAGACDGVGCVVSTLSGLRETILDAQQHLLDGAIHARVPRFIPSDFSIDFTRLPIGSNRNLDLRREFHQRLGAEPIATTTIFNGAFLEMLAKEMPLVMPRLRRVVYWGDSPDVPLDFTAKDDVADYTAAAALDPTTPRVLRIAGATVTARDVARLMTELSGRPFKLFRAGSLGRLGRMIHLFRAVQPGERTLYPAWQGMQYLHNMFDGRGRLTPLDNGRYADVRWTPIADVLGRMVTT